MGKGFTEWSAFQGSIVVSQVVLEGEEGIPGRLNAHAWTSVKACTAGEDSSQPLLFYLCLNVNIS